MASFSVFDESDSDEEFPCKGNDSKSSSKAAGGEQLLPVVLVNSAQKLVSRLLLSDGGSTIEALRVNEDGESEVADDLQRCLDIVSGVEHSDLNITALEEAMPLARRVHTKAFAHLEKYGQWRAACWCNAFLSCQVIDAVCLLARSEAQMAMRCIDRACIIGGNIPELNIITAIVEPLARVERKANKSASWCNDVLFPKSGIACGAVIHENEEQVHECAEIPSADSFYETFYLHQRPVVIRNFASMWPAMERWRRLDYMSELFGHRVIPVEIGRHGGGEEASSWSECFSTVDEFFKQYIIPSCTACSHSAYDPITASAPPAEIVAYLAQHALFDQFPSLKRDFTPPSDFCKRCNGGRGVQRTNAWLGTHGTKTPLHFDSYDNFLCQVTGAKFVRLYSPDVSSSKMYVSSESATTNQGNISPVDPEKPDLDAYPKFATVQGLDVVLKEGDALFIPRGYWHYVRSLSTSFSMNFWF